MVLPAMRSRPELFDDLGSYLGGSGFGRGAGVRGVRGGSGDGSGRFGGRFGTVRDGSGDRHLNSAEVLMIQYFTFSPNAGTGTLTLAAPTAVSHRAPLIDSAGAQKGRPPRSEGFAFGRGPRDRFPILGSRDCRGRAVGVGCRGGCRGCRGQSPISERGFQGLSGKLAETGTASGDR